ncbi:putative oxidoreductase [Rubripirellula amarantea]|uniref:Putative oxidoreductase n=1 Tax=Rubripirellula amarantea TaxID=2527999 RepID=A0A5C5WQZ1_9BACT|nr:SDR family NAD(P)-dependent oxidoreductase [Rubripirellula amarantea]TWT53226.1 putative oxidoreductase [Rubripirellula amarantea]
MSPSTIPVALVTGGSAGLGRAIAMRLVEKDYQVWITGRTERTLRQAATELSLGSRRPIQFAVADVTRPQDVEQLILRIAKESQRLDVIVNCVGTSDRGLIEGLTPDRVHELIDQNVVSTLNVCQASLALLAESQGVIVNIGSLASKVSPRFLGGYSIAKHSLAALTSQLRLELKPQGIHVGLVSPGPIRRDDAGSRYNDHVEDGLPDQAKKPGGGTRVSGLPPEVVVDAVMKCIVKRSPDLIRPRYLRPLIAIGHLFPRCGDWLLMKFTSSKS